MHVSIIVNDQYNITRYRKILRDLTNLYIM